MASCHSKRSGGASAPTRAFDGVSRAVGGVGRRVRAAGRGCRPRSSAGRACAFTLDAVAEVRFGETANNEDVRRRHAGALSCMGRGPGRRRPSTVGGRCGGDGRRCRVVVAAIAIVMVTRRAETPGGGSVHDPSRLLEWCQTQERPRSRSCGAQARLAVDEIGSVKTSAKKSPSALAAPQPGGHRRGAQATGSRSLSRATVTVDTGITQSYYQCVNGGSDDHQDDGVVQRGSGRAH